MCLWVVSQGHKPILGRSQLICTGGSLMVTVQYSNDYKDDKNEALHTQYIFCTDVPHGGPAFHAAGTEMESSKETGCRAPEDPILCINDYDFFGSAATMNMCSKCQKDMILLNQEYSKLAAVSSKDVVRRSSSSDESELALAGAAVTSANLASQISQVKSKEGLKKCTACRELLGCNDPKQMNQLKGFAFDCLLEYLDSKFSSISDSGFRTCTKLPSSMTKEILIVDIIDEVKEWTQFVGLIPDELIEWDMSHSLGKCTDFEIEEYECGTEVARHILQELVDEVVLDLYSSSSSIRQCHSAGFCGDTFHYICFLRVPVDCSAPQALLSCYSLYHPRQID
ncbi:hypothetical protein T459_18658 [Capsicum annuum]|uniref:A20-type domain-containing protein n=1 Tax=Capsicum annuum TaxID=4072 RepID=A0A2G2YZH4_CAPAN|nr:hypothetical protein T459_18658 [Capsicum annuum]